MAPAVPEHTRQTLHHATGIVDEESLHLLVEIRHQQAMSKPGYSSFDDTLSTSFMSSAGDLSHHDNELQQQEHNDNLSSPSLSCIKRLWNPYYDSLQRHPIVVKSIAAFFLLLLADLMAQGVENIRGIAHMHHANNNLDMDDAILSTATTILVPINWLRALRFGVFGLLGAPFTHYYYLALDTILPPTQNPWTCTTFVKVAVDQGIQAPAMLALIISGLAFMEGRGWDGIASDMQQQYIDALIMNWKLWVPATVVNLAFVPPILRVLYDNLVFFIWTIYLSMILNDDGMPMTTTLEDIARDPLNTTCCSLQCNNAKAKAKEKLVGPKTATVDGDSYQCDRQPLYSVHT